MRQLELTCNTYQYEFVFNRELVKFSKMTTNKKNQKVAVVMGSQSDYSVMKKCEEILKVLKINFEIKIVSAHRTPDRMFAFAKAAAKNN